jgi:hypothetical protein
MSMDSNGKIIFAKHSEISQANLKNLAGMSRPFPSSNKARCIILLVYFSIILHVSANIFLNLQSERHALRSNNKLLDSII